MILERTKDEILVRLPASVNLKELQSMLDYLHYMELSCNSLAKQSDADKLANEVNEAIWNKVKAKRGIE